MMNKTIDLTYNEVSDDQKGTHLFGISTQTVKKCIVRLEKEYFKGRNIFRNNNEKSDFLFRYEIKDLLLFLIELECNDVFRNGRVKKDGVSERSMSQILKSYEKILNDDTLRDYERRLLLINFNGEGAHDFVKTMYRFQNALTIFMVLVVRHYNSFSSDFFEDIISQLEAWSMNIVAHSKIVESIHDSDVLHVNETKKTIYVGKTHNLEINLKNTVVRTINLLADFFYEFDENGVCTRKSLSHQVSKLDLGEKKESLVEQSKRLFDEYIYALNSDDEFETVSANDLNDITSIDVLRSEMDKLFDDICKILFPNSWQKPLENTDDESEDKFSCASNLYYAASEHLFFYLIVRCVCSGEYESHCLPHNLFGTFEHEREALYNSKIADVPYKMYARKLEKWCWEYIQNNKSIDINSIFKNGEFVENNIQERINVAAFQKREHAN